MTYDKYIFYDSTARDSQKFWLWCVQATAIVRFVLTTTLPWAIMVAVEEGVVLNRMKWLRLTEISNISTRTPRKNFYRIQRIWACTTTLTLWWLWAQRWKAVTGLTWSPKTPQSTILSLLRIITLTQRSVVVRARNIALSQSTSATGTSHKHTKWLLPYLTASLMWRAL